MKIVALETWEKKVCVVLGIRPGIIKMTPVIRALKAKTVDFFILHTGQHYSQSLDQKFFADLKLPEPTYRLDNVQHYSSCLLYTSPSPRD